MSDAFCAAKSTFSFFFFSFCLIFYLFQLIRPPYPLTYKPLHFEYIHRGAYSDGWLACTQKRLCASWKKIGEYKWDMEMTTEADTADTVAAEAADAAAASEEAAVAADTAAHAK